MVEEDLYFVGSAAPARVQTAFSWSSSMESLASAPAEVGKYIEHACRRGVVASVAVETAGAWRLCRARMLGFNTRRGVIWCEQPTPIFGAQSVNLDAQQRIAMRFASIDRQITFQGALSQVRALGGSGEVRNLVEIVLPREIICENLRWSFRVQMSDEDACRMVMWKLDMQRRLEPDDTVSCFTATVRDLSIGGASVTNLDGEPDWKPGEHIGLELHAPGEEPMLLFAELRRITKPKDRPASYGLSFLGAETPLKTFNSQETLSRLVNQQQRRYLQKRVETPA